MTTSFHWKEWFGSIVLVKPAIFLYWSACTKPGNWTVYIYIYIYIYSKTTGKEYAMFSNVNYKYLMWFTSLTVTSAGRNAWEKVSNHSTKEWMDTEMTLRKRRSCPWVNTLCRRDIHWMTLMLLCCILDVYVYKHIGKPNNLKGYGSKKNKRPKWDCQNLHFF
jgi:hypothetical protein